MQRDVSLYLVWTLSQQFEIFHTESTNLTVNFTHTVPSIMSCCWKYQSCIGVHVTIKVTSKFISDELVWLNGSSENISVSVWHDVSVSVCVTEINTRHAHSGKNMFRAVCTCARHYSHPTCLHSYELITAVLMMVIFSLSLSSCVFVCFCVSAIPSMLWEAGKQSPVGDGLLRSISYHQGNRAFPSVKLTFPGTIRECVCLYRFNIKPNLNTTERKVLGFPRKNMHVQNTSVRSSYKLRGKWWSFLVHSVFPIVQMLIYIASCGSVL